MINRGYEIISTPFAYFNRFLLLKVNYYLLLQMIYSLPEKFNVCDIPFPNQYFALRELS